MGAHVVRTGGTHSSDQGDAWGSDQAAMLAPQEPLQTHPEPDKATHRHYLTRAMVGSESLVLRGSLTPSTKWRGWRP